MAVHSRLFHIDTCAGTGGVSLALNRVYGEQLKTVAYVERDSYAAVAMSRGPTAQQRLEAHAEGSRHAHGGRQAGVGALA